MTTVPPRSLPDRVLDGAAALRAPHALLLVALLLLMQIASWWVPGRDAAAYLSIAASTAEGAPARFGSPHLYYAPGYPVLIAPTYAIDERPFLAISLLQFAFTLIAAWLTLRWMRRLVGGAAPLLTVLVFVNVGLWALYRATLAEMAFLCIMLGAVEAWRDVHGATTWRRLVLGGVLAALALLTRQAGVMLLGGLALVLVLAARRGRLPWSTAVLRGVVCALPAVVAGAALLAYDAHTAAEAGREDVRYVAQAVDGEHGLATQLLEGLRLRSAELGRLLVPGMHKAYAPARTWLHVNTLVYGLVTLVVGLGWWRSTRARTDVLLWTAPCYVLLYIVWPFDQGTRFLAPLLPVWTAALWFAARAWEGRRRTALVLFLVVAHLGVATGAWLKQRELARYDDRWPWIDRVVEVVGEDRDRVEAIGLDRHERLMLQVGLDRPLLEAPSGAPPARAWRVLGPEETPPAGWDRVALGGTPPPAWRLFRRGTAGSPR